MVSPYFFRQKVAIFIFIILKKLVIVLNSDDVFSHRQHSHPLCLPRDHFSSILSKFSCKKLYSSGCHPGGGVLPHASDATECIKSSCSHW